MRVLVVAGAGTSVELGVPAMRGLAEEFLDHATQWGVEPALVGQILEASMDIEHLIEELDHICAAKSSLATLGGDAAEVGQFDQVRAEIEWFIQHAAERVSAREAALMWSSVLRAGVGHDLTIVTTNYDRAIELAANAERVDVDDGFGSFDQREIAHWVGFGGRGPRLRLVKLHGSTDWYAVGSPGEPVKLRHPMPLFGRATLRLPRGDELGSALILPSREKLLTRAPYPRLSQAFLNATDACDLAVVVGSSLRDHHLRGAAEAIARRVPLFVVAPDVSATSIIGARTIAQTASRFLIGTLPRALYDANPEAVLRDASAMTGLPGADSLHPLVLALDASISRDVRCRAVESLEEQGVALEHDLLRQLIGGVDPQVARYALGLIPAWVDVGQALDIARHSPHFSGDVAFREDVGLLCEILGQPLLES